MFKKLLLWTMLACGLIVQAQAQAVNVQGYVRVPGTTQGIPNQWVVLLINTGNPANSIMDSLQTDSMGFFSNSYLFNPNVPNGGVTGIYVCNGTVLYDSANWSPSNPLVVLNFFCGSLPPPTGGWMCGSVQPLAVGDTAAISLYRFGAGGPILDTTLYRWDSTGLGSIPYCFQARPGAAQHLIKAELTAGSASANNYLPTWYGNTTQLSQATIITSLAGITVQLQPLVLQQSTGSPTNYLIGTVTGNTPANPMQYDSIRLILIEVQNNIWTPVDTFYTLDSMGFAPFYLPTNSTGTHSILATLMTGNAANFVPTYFGNATTWSAASTFNLGGGNSVVISIALQAAGGTGGGGGSAGGGVNQGGLPITGSTGMPGVQLQLHDMQGQVLKAVHTNAQGVYNMSNLAFGSYKMHVEMMGVAFTPYPFTLSSSNPNAQLHFTVNQSGIAASLVESGVRIDGVYPNPATDVLNINLSSQQSGQVELKLLDITGRTLQSTTWLMNEGEATHRLSLDGIPAGIYLLEMRSANSFTAQRIVKQ